MRPRFKTMRVATVALLAATCLSSGVALSQQRVFVFWPNREPMTMGIQPPVEEQEPLDIELSLPTPFGLTVGQPVALAVSTQGDTDGVTYRTAASASMPGLTVNTSNGSISGIPTAPAGTTYSIAVEAVRSGTVVGTTPPISKVLRAAIEIDLVPDDIELAAGEPFPSGGIVAGATGGDQDTIAWSLNNAPDWLNVVAVAPGGAMLQQAAGTDIGETAAATVTLVAADAEGRQDTDTFNVEVSTASIALNVPSPFGLTTGESVNLTMAAADGFSNVTYVAGEGAVMNGLSVDSSTGTVTGQPTGPAGTAYHIVVDAVRNGTTIASTVLDRVLRDPISVTAPDDLMLAAGDELSLSGAGLVVSAIGGDQPTLAWSIEDAPSWLTIESTGPGVATLKQIAGEQITQSGTWTVTVVAQDAEGRVDASATFDVNVTPGLLAFDVPAAFGLTTGQATSLHLASASPLDGVAYRASPDAAMNGLTVDPETGAISGIPSATAGTQYSILVEAIVDDTVVATASLARTLRDPIDVDVLPDDLILALGEGFPTSGIEVKASGGDSDSIAWTLENAPTWLAIEANGTGSAVLKQAEGAAIAETQPVEVTIVASDAEGRSDASASFQVEVVPAAIALDVPSPFGLTTGQGVNLQLAATVDLDGVTYAPADDAVMDGLSVDAETGAVSGTPSATADTPYEIAVAAVRNGAVIATTAPVARTLRAPLSVTTGPADMDLVAGDDFPTEGIQIATSGGDRQSFNWSLIDAPSWLTIESGNDGTAVLKQVSGQPITETEGLTVTVSVSDNEGRSGSDSFSIHVEPADETAPTWLTATVLPDALTGQGSPYTTSVSASDASGSVTYSVVDAEPALVSYDAQTGALQMTGWADASLDPDTGAFKGTPTTVGDYTVTVRATDASGNSADREFSLQVNDGIDPVWTTDASLPGGTAEEAYAATVVATDETSDVSYTLYGTAPGWVSVSSSGQITGTAGSAGSYSFTVRASDDAGNFADREFGIEVEADCKTGPIGTACSDGAIYAGMLDGVRLYAAPADENERLSWNNGNELHPGESGISTGATSETNGLMNTNLLLTIVNTDAPYMAAQACRAHGSDWYLPAKQELNLLYTNRNSIGGFNTTPPLFDDMSSTYWSSTEDSDEYAKRQTFGDGYQDQHYKHLLYLVRCVRR